MRLLGGRGYSKKGLNRTLSNSNKWEMVKSTKTKKKQPRGRRKQCDATEAKKGGVSRKGNVAERVTCCREGKNTRYERCPFHPSYPQYSCPPLHLFFTHPNHLITHPLSPLTHPLPPPLSRKPWLAPLLSAGQEELTCWQTAFFTFSQYEQGPKTMIPNIWISSICDLSSYIGIPQSLRQSNAAGFINTSNTLSV